MSGPDSCRSRQGPRKQVLRCHRAVAIGSMLHAPGMKIEASSSFPTLLVCGLFSRVTKSYALSAEPPPQVCFSMMEAIC